MSKFVIVIPDYYMVIVAVITGFVSCQTVTQDKGKYIVVCQMHATVTDGPFNCINVMKIANTYRTYKLLKKFTCKIRKNPTEKFVMQYVNKRLYVIEISQNF